MNEEKIKTKLPMPRKHKIIIGILVGIIALLLLINFIKFGTIVPFFMIYSWVLAKLSGVGFNDYLIRIIAIPSALAIWFAIFRLACSFNKQKRLLGYIILAFIFLAHSVFMFTITKDDYFARTSGKSIKYYTISPITGEINLFDYPIFDEFGNKAQPITSDITEEIEARKMYPGAEIQYSEIATFFDRIKGKPLIYYCIDSNGIYHFYIKDGYSPIDGQQLKPFIQDAKIRYEKSKANAAKQETQIRQQGERIKQLQTKLKTQNTSSLTQQVDSLQKEIKKLQTSSKGSNKSEQIDTLEKEIRYLKQAESRRQKKPRQPTATPIPNPNAQYLGVLINENEKEKRTFVITDDIQTITREVKPQTFMTLYIPQGNYNWRILKKTDVRQKGQLQIRSNSKSIAFNESSYLDRDFTKVSASKEKNAEKTGKYFFRLTTE